MERGAAVLVTTHLDELKALALTDPRYANARVGFDAERLAPTYQLHLGGPGSSSAIEVAARVGLPAPLVDRARAALAGHGGALGQALRALDDERARLAEERRAAETARAAARKAEGRARAAEEAARRAEREAAARMGEALAEELDAARAEVADLLAGLQARPTVRAATDAPQKLDAWRETVARAAATKARAEAGAEALPGGEVKRGVRVRIVSLGQEGEVVEVDGADALVRAGPLKVRRPVADLVPLAGKAKDTAKLGRSRSEKLAAAADARPDAPRGTERRLDARGLRVEELIREVERFLDRVYSGGEGECLILHGHGTGALKQALRDHLSASPYVGAFRPGDRHEGGDAVTVVTLRR